MEIPFDLLAKVDLTNLLAMAAMFWVFNWHLNAKFDKIDRRFDKLENDMKEIRTSLNRLEGAFMNKDCCMIKDDRNLKKAE